VKRFLWRRVCARLFVIVQSSPSFSQEPIKIRVYLCLLRPPAELWADGKTRAQQAIEEVNDSGGVLDGSWWSCMRRSR
jgi:hypothetical protein